MGTVFDDISYNTAQGANAAERSARSQEIMNFQLSGLLAVSTEQLNVQQQQLSVQQQIRASTKNSLPSASSSLPVGQQQLVQAIRTVRRLDLTNARLAAIDTSLTDISGQLAQQNSLIERSMDRLTTESQELIRRGIGAYNNGWFADAERDLEAAVEKDPYAAVGHYYLAKCLAAKGQTERAKLSYQKCVHYGRRVAPIFECFAQCDMASQQLQNADSTKAREYLDQAVQCSEQDAIEVARVLLQCDLVEGKISHATLTYVAQAFQDEMADPEVLLEVLLGAANERTRTKEAGQALPDKAKPGAAAETRSMGASLVAKQAPGEDFDRGD